MSVSTRFTDALEDPLSSAEEESVAWSGRGSPGARCQAITRLPLQKRSAWYESDTDTSSEASVPGSRTSETELYELDDLNRIFASWAEEDEVRSETWIPSDDTRIVRQKVYTKLAKMVKKVKLGDMAMKAKLGDMVKKAKLAEVAKKVRKVSSKTVFVTAVGAAVGFAVAPVAAPAVLGIIGFSAAGPVAGSIAAGIQAGLGKIAAGSLFAGAQSVAMGGSLPVIGNVISGGIVGGAAAGVKKLVSNKSTEK